MSEIEIGRLLRASTAACVVGCRVSQTSAPAFGGLVRIPLEDGYGIYGLIYDIRINDDGLVRQLVTAEGIDEDVIQDNRVNRNVPGEVSVLHVGYRQELNEIEEYKKAWSQPGALTGMLNWYRNIFSRS